MLQDDLYKLVRLSNFPTAEEAQERDLKASKAEGILTTLSTVVLAELLFEDKRLKWGVVLATSIGEIIRDRCLQQHVEKQRHEKSGELKRSSGAIQI